MRVGDDGHRVEAVEEEEDLDEHAKGRDVAVDDIERVEASLEYPSHAILRCCDIPTADFLADHINAALSANRERYPVELGWTAAAAHSKGEKLDEKTAQLIHLQRVLMEHQANSPVKSTELVQALGDGVQK